MAHALGGEPIPPPRTYFTRAFWGYELICVILAAFAVPITLHSTEARLLRDGKSVEARVVESRGDDEYLVVYGDYSFAVTTDEDETLHPEDRLDLLVDPDNPAIHSRPGDAWFAVGFGICVALLPLAFPVGWWWRRQRARRRVVVLPTWPP